MNFMNMTNPALTPDSEFAYLDTRLQTSGSLVFPVQMPAQCVPQNNQIVFQLRNGQYQIYLKHPSSCSAANTELAQLCSGTPVNFSSMQAIQQYFRSMQYSDAAHAPTATPSRRVIPETERGALDIKRNRRRMQTINVDTLFSDITETVRGQDDAIQTVARYVCAAAAKQNPKRPPSLVLAGNTGEGKTLVGKTLAEALNRQISDRSKHFGTIIVQCNELTENHDVSRLVGGSPNYVGYGDDNLLTPVLSNPYQVIVFDEIEKAAPRVLDILMGALDCGEIMMSKPIDGKSMIDLKHCILLFTTNLRVSDNGQKTHKKQIGFYSASEAQYASDDLSIRYRDAMVAQGMRREIAARFTDIICFQKLTGDAVVDIILREIQSCAEEYGFNISYVSPEITQSLYDEIETSGFGARMIKRAVSKRFDLFFAADPAAGSEEQFALTGSCDAPILLQNS